MQTEGAHVRKDIIEEYHGVSSKKSYRQFFRPAGEKNPDCYPINPCRKADIAVEPPHSLGGVAVFIVLIALGVAGIWFLMVWQIVARLRGIYLSL